MAMITLRYLKKSDEEQFLESLEADWEDFPYAHYWESLAKEDFERYLEIIPGFPKGQHIPKDHVPCSFLFAFNENDDLVGRTSIRHELTDFLLKAGGHIGYAVLPDQRRKGYASAILKASLEYVRANLPHLEKVLVTCDEGNVGSEKTII
ncbi:MAG: putative acetyltransferase, partial [Bacteriovoracaceae bacterium]